jgi:hypothetical protein
LQIKTKIVCCHTADSKPVKQEVNSTVILPRLVFLGKSFGTLSAHQTGRPVGRVKFRVNLVGICNTLEISRTQLSFPQDSWVREIQSEFSSFYLVTLFFLSSNFVPNSVLRKNSENEVAFNPHPVLPQLEKPSILLTAKVNSLDKLDIYRLVYSKAIVALS